MSPRPGIDPATRALGSEALGVAVGQAFADGTKPHVRPHSIAALVAEGGPHQQRVAQAAGIQRAGRAVAVDHRDLVSISVVGDQGIGVAVGNARLVNHTGAGIA